MKKIILFIVLLLSLSNLFSVYHKIGAYFEIEDPYRIEIQGNRAYVLDEEQDLVILDVSDPTEPVFLGDHSINDPHYLAISGRILCVSTDDYILILDIADPQSPALLSSISFEDNWGKIKIHDNILYVQKDLDEMYMFDIENPQTPIFLNSFDFVSYISDFAIENDIIFITGDNQQYLKIVDVSEPTIPILLSEYETRGDALGVYACDDLVYFCDNASGLVLMDVQAPQNPQVINHYPILRDFKKLIVCNEIVYALNKYLGFSAVDFADQSDPELLCEYDSYYNTLDFALLGDHMLLADEEIGIQIIDISEPVNFNMLFKFSNESQVIRIKDNFLVNSGGGLRVFDFTDPYRPELLGINYAAFQKNLEIRENYIYGAHYSNYGNSSLQVIDITIPATPTITAICELSQTVSDLVINGDMAYLSAAGEGVHLVDISDPENPIWVSSYNTPNQARKVDYFDEKLYVADGFAGLQIIDVSDAENPSYLGCYNQISSAVSVVVKDTVAAILEQDSEIHIVDISDPQSTNLLTTIFPHSDSYLNSEMKIFENHLIIHDKAWNELLIYDITDPNFPECVTSYRWNYRADTFDIDGEYLVTGNQFNLIVHRCELPTSTDNHVIYSLSDHLKNYPNPFNPETTISFNLQKDSEVDLVVYNIKGQRIKQLIDHHLKKGSHSVVWNGMDDNNKTVSTGIYFYQLRLNNTIIDNNMMMLLK